MTLVLPALVSWMIVPSLPRPVSTRYAVNWKLAPRWGLLTLETITFPLRRSS